MRFKDLVTSAIFALSISLLFQYLFFGGRSQTVQENSFVAPKEKKEYKPLNTEIDFLDRKQNFLPVISTLETAWGHMNFSTYGASLDSIDFKRKRDDHIQTIRTIFPLPDTKREERCFLVGLDEQTPFYYVLDFLNEEQENYILTYSGDNDICTIKKTFVIEKIKPLIHLKLEVIPKKDIKKSIQPRIFYPSPLMLDIKNSDTISTCIVDKFDVFSKQRTDQLLISQGWFAPHMFGSDSKYFIHTMIADSQHFVERAYYRLEERDHLFSILEGPAVTTISSWELSFYFGPKELDYLTIVDPTHNLEKTLDYSNWFAPIAKIMLYLLRWFYKYLHNYGLAIAALTLLFHLLLLPLTLRNNEEKFKKQQAEYQKKLALLKKRFADQPDKLAVEQAELLRKEGMPGLGCLLPLLVQIPLFFALSRVLSNSFELYQAPMLWISDLSAKDPYYILPVLMVIIMIVHDGKVDTQQRISKFLMAIVFGAITTTFAAGLTLYLLLGRIFNFIQARIMKYFNMV